MSNYSTCLDQISALKELYAGVDWRGTSEARAELIRRISAMSSTERLLQNVLFDPEDYPTAFSILNAADFTEKFVAEVRDSLPMDMPQAGRNLFSDLVYKKNPFLSTIPKHYASTQIEIVE